MSVQLKANYINPLTMLKENSAAHKAGQMVAPKEKADKIKELQAKQQQLQNEMLLLKSNGSASGDISAKRQEKIEDRLEEVENDLRTARADTGSTALSRREPDQDYYKKEDGASSFTGIYRPEPYRLQAYEKTAAGFSAYADI